LTEVSSVVVVLDDDRANLALVKRILAHRPSLVLRTETEGQRGLALIREVQPAVVLLDLHLPGLDGEAVLRALRDDPATADTQVVIVSGDASTDTSRRLRAAGAQHFLTKPFDVAALLDLVDGIVSGDS
jgi:CheY-like chemotaxis protein